MSQKFAISRDTIILIIGTIWTMTVLVMWILACTEPTKVVLVDVPETIKYLVVALTIGKVAPLAIKAYSERQGTITIVEKKAGN